MIRLTFPRKTFLTGCGALMAAGPFVARADASDVAALRRHPSSVASMRVFLLDPSITTLVAVTPGTLETFKGVRVTTHTDAASIRTVLDALAASKAQPGTSPADVRYGVVFFGAANRRLLSAYADRYGTRGAIDAARVTYGDPGPLIAALKRASH